MTGRIDTHHHVVPPVYAEWLAGQGIDAGGLPIPCWDAETALAVMDGNGVETAILSVSTPGVLDTTRAALRLAASGTLDRCPRLRAILSHAGGFVPYAAHRIAISASPDRDPAEGLAQLRRYYFDIALSGTPTVLPSLLQFAAADHVVFGSDWPYAPARAVAAFTGMYDAHPLDTEQRHSIDRGAAEALFPRLVTPAPDGQSNGGHP